MKQLYQDTIALSTKFGRPDLFITFTCNPQWPEVIENLLPGEKATDRPDLIARVFNLKAKALMKEIIKDKVFGRVRAYAYTIEFQKRGLPHKHLLIILHAEDRFFTAAEVDATDSEKNVCSKGFPKDFCNETVFEPDFGYPKYRRRRPSTPPEDPSKQNCWVVPYNPYLTAKYDAHINVEICANVKACKYIYKYVHKGSDRASLRIVREDGQNPTSVESVDEIQEYRDARWIGSAEACWKIFGFKLHDHNPPISRLSLHLPNQHSVQLDDEDNLNTVMDPASTRRTTLTAFFELNRARLRDGDQSELFYTDVLQNYVWKAKEQQWSIRQRARGTIARMYYINPSSGDLFYLRFLLLHVPNPLSFEHLRTVDGVVKSSFHEACVARGLLHNDAEWDEILGQTGEWQGGYPLRSLFAQILLLCEPSNPLDLWNKHKSRLSDDCEHILRTQYSNAFEFSTDLADRVIAVDDFCLHLIQVCLEETNSISSKDVRVHKGFGLPAIQRDWEAHHNDGRNRLLREELGHDTHDWQERWEGLNAGQMAAADAIFDAVSFSNGQLFFLDGFGGTGKTMLQNTVLRRVRSEGNVAIAVASSGIASILLQGGRTAHSRFKIPLNATAESSCNVAKGTMESEVFKEAKLIFWDEISMQNRFDIEAVYRMLQDIRGNDKPFGGIVTCFCGDFRQILPVIKGAGSGRIINATLRKSYLWDHIQVLRLTENMRLRNPNLIYRGRSEMAQFAEELLNVGNGTSASTAGPNSVDWSIGWVSANTTTALIDAIYGHHDPSNQPLDFWTSRAILCTLNKNVSQFNSKVLDKFPGNKIVCSNRDQVINEEDNFLLPTEVMNVFEPAALPPHHLELKENCIVMLLRNLKPPEGLCNGTRLQVKNIASKVLDCRILSDEQGDKRHFIPRIPLEPPDSNTLHAPFRRIQFPVRLAFSMTINKSQGQSQRHVCLCLHPEVFSHGQLYVALSRVTSKAGLSIVAPGELPRRQPTAPARCIRNHVLKQVLLEQTQPPPPPLPATAVAAAA